MIHIEEFRLECYVLAPTSLQTEDRQQVESHLQTCGACRSVAEYLRSFHEELASQPAALPPRLEAFVQSLFRPARIIPLKPSKLQPEPPACATPAPLVLAALTPPLGAPRFRRVVTLAAESHDAMVRILHDRESDTFRLYVYAGDAARSKRALVWFPELAIEIVTGEKGVAVFRLPQGQVPKDWEKLKAELRLPVATFQITAPMLEQAKQPAGILIHGEEPAGLAVSLGFDQEALTISSRSGLQKGSEISSAVITTVAGETYFTRLELGRGRVPAMPPPFTLILYP